MSAVGRPRRVSAQLTPSGWTYLLASPLWAVAAMLDPLGAAPAAAWVVVGLAHLLLARLNLGSLALEMECLSPRTRVGRPATIRLTLHRRRRGLVAAEALFIRLRHPGCQGGHQVEVPASLRPGSSISLETDVTPNRFGRSFVSAADIFSVHPFGLYRLTAEWIPAPTVSLAVWPRQARIPARGAGLKTSAGPAGGSQSQPGCEVRPYLPGDPLALVCWKTTARTGRHHVRPRESLVLRQRTLVVSTQRQPWIHPSQFWSMIALACALLEDGYRRGHLAALQIDSTRFPLSHPEGFVAAMDALSTAHPRRHRSPLPSGPRWAVYLRPFGRRGVRAVTEGGAVMSHVL